jgi:CheY-like chemotaxis protein
MLKVPVLVVEDEPLILMEIEETLIGAGYSTHAARSGEDAISLLELNREYHGLITDVNLGGGKTGWDVAQRARELHPDLPVVYVSGHGGADWSARGVPKSIFIQKPFAPAQITTAISQLLNVNDTLTA